MKITQREKRNPVFQAYCPLNFLQEYFNKTVYLQVNRRHLLTNTMGLDNNMFVPDQNSYCLNCNSVSNKQRKLISINLLTFPLLRNNLLCRNSLLSEFTNLLLLLLNITLKSQQFQLTITVF